MAFLLPTAVVENVLDITPALLHAMHVNTILLDVDNTLAIHGSQTPFEGTVEWSHKMRQEGFRIIILSNNFKERVAPFAAKYGLAFLSFSMKPLPWAYYRAIFQLSVKRTDAVVVGDQIFTDVIGANLSFMKSILLTPGGREDSVSFRIRRACERPIRRRVEKLGIGKQFFKDE